MFFTIFIVLLLLALTVHELSHGIIMRKYGIVVPEAGLGLPLPYLPSISIRVSPNFTFKIHPFLIGAYVRPAEEAQIEKLPYREKAHIYGAGIIANFIMGFLMIMPWMIVKLIIHPEARVTNLLILILLVFLTFVLWRFGGKISAYVFPFLGVVMVSYLIWSMITIGVKENIMGPIGLFKMGLGLVSLYQATMWGAQVSIGFAMFNLLPLIPLDGGRIAMGFLEDRPNLNYGVKKTITIGSITLFFALIILVLFVDVARTIS